MKRHEQWGMWTPSDEAEIKFANVARRRVVGLITAVQFNPAIPFHDVLACAYIQGANDMLQVALPNITPPVKPHITLKVSS